MFYHIPQHHFGFLRYLNPDLLDHGQLLTFYRAEANVLTDIAATEQALFQGKAEYAEEKKAGSATYKTLLLTLFVIVISSVLVLFNNNPMTIEKIVLMGISVCCLTLTILQNFRLRGLKNEQHKYRQSKDILFDKLSELRNKIDEQIIGTRKN